MTRQRYRRPLLILASAVAVLSFAAVGAVIAGASNHVATPVWVTSAALYGLPLAFLLMLALVVDGAAARRRPPERRER